MGDPDVISIPEAAELLGISRDLGYDLARRGQLPGALQLGRRWRVSAVRLRAAIHGDSDSSIQGQRAEGSAVRHRMGGTEPSCG